MNKGKTVGKVILTVFCILTMVGLLGVQLIVLYSQSQYHIHFIHSQYFYLLNGLIVIFACLSLVFWFSRKGKAVILILTTSLVSLLLVVAFLFPSSRTFFSVSSDGNNIFEMQQNRKTGILSYERNIYYFLSERLDRKIPKPSKSNGYLLFSQTLENLEYPGAKKYQMTWINNEVCVFTYQTKDGSYCQYVRGYGDYVANTDQEEEATRINGNWKGKKASLTAGDSTYQLLIGDKSYTIDPDYSEVLNAELAVYKTTEGEAVCTILVSENRLWVVPADKGKVYVLNRQ